MDNTTRIGRPMASVASMMLKSSESRAVRAWVNGCLQMLTSEGRIQQRGSGDKHLGEVDHDLRLAIAETPEEGR